MFETHSGVGEERNRNQQDPGKISTRNYFPGKQTRKKAIQCIIVRRIPHPHHYKHYIKPTLVKTQSPSPKHRPQHTPSTVAQFWS
jgi:hypothetical protein